MFFCFFYCKCYDILKCGVINLTTYFIFIIMITFMLVLFIVVAIDNRYCGLQYKIVQ